MMEAAPTDPVAAPLEGQPTQASSNLTPPSSTTLPVPGDTSAFPMPEKEVNGPEEDIEPDHYYGGGKIPVFKPVSASDRLATWLAPAGI